MKVASQSLIDINNVTPPEGSAESEQPPEACAGVDAATKMAIESFDARIAYLEGVFQGLQFARAVLVKNAGQEKPNIGDDARQVAKLVAAVEGHADA